LDKTQRPLLDSMGAVIDHVQAHSLGGPADLSNLVTSSNKCNLVKSNLSAKEFREREPENWDGFI
jgi:5-methylcytosine-specific restriction endonuclease McrA